MAGPAGRLGVLGAGSVGVNVRPARFNSLTALTKRTGITLVVLAVALMATAGAFIGTGLATSVGNALGGPIASTPTDQVKHLSPGRYVIFERTGTQSGVGGFSVTENAAVTITPAQVIITDPSGRAVAADAETSNQTTNRNGQIFTGAVRFQASTSGRYEIRVTSDSPSQVIISEDLGPAFAAVLGWFGALFGGMVLLTVGIVVLVRGRRRATHPA
jgi:hypothetical protein